MNDPVEYIGRNYADVDFDADDWGYCWPILDPDTLMIVGIYHPNDGDAGVMLVDVVDGRCVVRGGACNAVIAID